MKIKGNFVLREIVGEYVLVPVNETALNFNAVISLNEAGAMIWQDLQMQKTAAQILSHLVSEFEVTKEEAMTDLGDFLDQLKENNLIE